MSRHDKERLADITAAIIAIRAHLQRGELSDALISDAVPVRLIEIGEAVKGIGDDLLETEPGIPWTQITAMRDRLAHRYFDISTLARNNRICRAVRGYRDETDQNPSK